MDSLDLHFENLEMEAEELRRRIQEAELSGAGFLDVRYMKRNLEQIEHRLGWRALAGRIGR